MRETYVPVLQARQKMKQPSTEDIDRAEKETTVSEKFLQAILRPLAMLLLSPVILLFSLYVALVYGYLYLLITTIPEVFTSNYDYSTSQVGLVYLGLGIGMMTSVIVFGIVSDRLLRRLSSKTADGEMKPEHRLPPLVPGAFLVPAGIILYGWSAQYKLHWAIPVLGTVLLGAGLNSILMSIQTYLVDAFPLYEASALAANTVVRSAAGALLPLVGPDMYRALGLGWGSSLLGLIAFAFVPVPFLFLKHGERLRAGDRFQNPR
jgi:MFS family permease